jgi:hypothetical protein
MFGNGSALLGDETAQVSEMKNGCSMFEIRRRTIFEAMHRQNIIDDSTHFR